MFTSEEFILQDITKIDGQIITAGEFFVKEQYLCSMQVNTNWYWNQQPQHNISTVPTLTILHPRLEINAVIDFTQYLKVYVTGYNQTSSYQNNL